MKVKASENKVFFVCNTCGNEFLKWSGKCTSCGEWNSLVETRRVESKGQRVKSKGLKENIETTNLSSLSALGSSLLRLKTGYAEFDRTLGGGFVPGQVVLLAGEPGIGKSTLLLQIAEAICGKGNPKFQNLNPKQISSSNDQKSKRFGNLDLENSNLFRASNLGFRVLYVAGEESPLQIKQRAERLGLRGGGIEIVSSTDADTIVEMINSNFETLNPKQTQDPKSQISNLKFQMLIVDSIQTLTTEDVASSAGSVAQVKECARRLTAMAKEKGLPLILIGHVNKEGDIAGPKVLEHIVDTVLYLEGERTLPFRILRAVKNRFGDPSEIGVWQMGDKGFRPVPNPGAAFLGAKVAAPGAVVTVVLEGNRPLLVEVQALVVKTAFGYPRRAATGYDLNRLFFLTAVLEKHLKLPLPSFDVYVNVTGGIKITEPAADLAVALAIVSSFKSQSVKSGCAVFGEVGLAGEVRGVVLAERRTKEAEKLGFGHVIAPGKVGTLKEAVASALV